LVGKIEGKSPLQRQNLRGFLILKWMLERDDVVVWTE
jgi:hypothetical protein